MMAQIPSRPRNQHDYQVAIICALTIEADMVLNAFDEAQDSAKLSFRQARGDRNTYKFGTIEGHNVVLVCLPDMGSIRAATASANLSTSFPAMRIAFVVGICGASPINTSTQEEILLGDCIVSTAVMQYDYGRQHPDDFISKTGSEASLDRPSPAVQAFLTKIQSAQTIRNLEDRMILNLKNIQRKEPKARYPSALKDHLYHSSYPHTHRGPQERCNECLAAVNTCKRSCDALGCESSQLLDRKRLTMRKTSNADPLPLIHFGIYGSASRVLRSGLHRDRLTENYNIIAFEMEGAGTWGNLPTIVLKSACDYADSHKNKEWQDYAAATAAAGLRSIIKELDLCDKIMQSKDLVSCYSIPSIRNADFTGRQTILVDLEQSVINTGAREHAIFGLGGVGKTQLALELCYTIQAKYPDYSIFWASALSIARFKQDITRIAKACSLPIDSNEDSVIPLVKEYLSSEQAGKWLFVVDNADDEEVLFNDEGMGLVDDWLPHSETGTTLFTTRHKDIAVDLADGRLLHLTEMNKEEATTLIRKWLTENELTKDLLATDKLFEILTFLPLAIAQAGSYICKNSISITKYLTLIGDIEDEIRLLSDEFRDRTREKGSKNAVILTWMISFNQIKRNNPAAADLLFVLAFFEIKAIPLSILPCTQSKEKLGEAVNILLGYSFIYKTGYEDVFDMHRLIHGATKFWMQRENLTEYWAEQVVHHLSKIFPEAKWENQALWRQFIPHSISVVQVTPYLSTRDRALLCLSLSKVLGMDGRVNEALKWSSESFSWYSKSMSAPERERLNSQRELAVAYASKGVSKRALQMLEDVVGIQEKALPENHQDRLIAERHLGLLYPHLGQHKKGIELLQRVVNIQERELPKDDEELLAAQSSLAWCYWSYGQNEEAAELVEKVIMVQEGLPDYRPEKMHSQSSKSWLQLNGRELEKAIETQEKVVAIEKNLLAEDNPSRLESELRLAIYYKTNGQEQKAIDILERVTAIQADILSNGHPQRLKAEDALGVSYLDLGMHQKAIEILEKVSAMGAEAYPETHADRLELQLHLAKAYLKDRQARKATGILENIVAAETKCYSISNARALLHAQETLARALLADGNTKDAIALLEKTIAIDDRDKPKVEWPPKSYQLNLALAYLDDGRIEEATSLLEQVVEIRKSVYKEDHDALLSAQCELAKAYNKAGRTDEAVDLLENVVRLSEATLPEYRENRLQYREALAGTYVPKSGYERTIDLLEGVIPLRKKLLANDDERLLINQHNLANAYLESGRCSDAVRILIEVDEVRRKILPEEDENRLLTQHVLGKAYRASHQFTEAIALLKSVLDIRESLGEKLRPSLQDVQHELGRAYFGAKDYSTAVKIFEKLDAIKCKQLEEVDSSRLATQWMLGLAHIMLLHFPQGIQMLEKVVTIRQTLFADDHIIMVEAYHELGKAYYKSARYPEGIKLLEKGVEARLQSLPANDSLLLETRHDLARAYLDSGRVPEAIEILENIRAIRTQMDVAEDALDHLATHFELGRAYLKSRSFSKSIEMFKKTMGIRMGLLEPDHLIILETRHFMAQGYAASSCWKEIADLLGNLAEMQVTVPVGDFRCLEMQHLLGQAYINIGQFENAVQTLQMVVTVTSQFKEDPVFGWDTKQLLGQAYFAMNRYDEAISILENVYEIRSKSVPDDDPSMTQTLCVLDSAYSSYTGLAPPIRISEKLFAVRKNLKEDDPLRLYAEFQLGRGYMQANRGLEAVELFEHAVQVQNKTLQESDPNRLSGEFALAMALRRSNRLEESINMAKSVLERRRKLLPETDDGLVDTEYMLAEVYLAFGKLEESLELAEKVVKHRQSTLPETQQHRLKADELLAVLYVHLKRYPEGLEILEKVAEVRRITLPEGHPERVQSELSIPWVKLKQEEDLRQLKGQQ